MELIKNEGANSSGGFLGAIKGFYSKLMSPIAKLLFKWSRNLGSDNQQSGQAQITPWLDWLLKHEGEPEYTGSEPTPFVIECFKHTNYGELSGSTPPACAATLCAALEESGYLSPHRADAVSFSAYGTESALVSGAICVFQWPSGDHHVSCCLEPNKNLFLNGNQGHFLQRRSYDPKYIIAKRWPVKK